MSYGVGVRLVTTDEALARLADSMGTAPRRR